MKIIKKISSLHKSKSARAHTRERIKTGQEKSKKKDMHPPSMVLGHMVGGTSSFISGCVPGTVVSVCILHILSLQEPLFTLSLSTVLGVLIGALTSRASRTLACLLPGVKNSLTALCKTSSRASQTTIENTLINVMHCVLWTGTVALMFLWSDDKIPDTAFPTGMALSYLASVLVSVAGYAFGNSWRTSLTDISVLVFHVLTAIGVIVLLLTG